MTIFSKLNATGGIPKQRFVETFTGDTLDTYRWENTGTNATNGASDEINGGVFLYAGASNTNYSMISFNNKRHFSQTGSVCIAVWKQPTNNGGASTVGLLNDNSSWNTNFVGTRLWTTDTHYKLRTADGSTVSESANTSVARNTSYNSFKWEMTSSKASLTINGVHETDKTTNLPASALQPMAMSWNENGNRDYLHLQYMEVYNT